MNESNPLSYAGTSESEEAGNRRYTEPSLALYGKTLSGIDATLSLRGERYGEFKDHASISQGLKAVMRAAPKWALLSADKKEALEMVVHKIARILNGDPEYVDSWHDIVGYASLVEAKLRKHYGQ